MNAALPQQGSPAHIDGVRVVLLDSVRRAAPRIHVKGAVDLFGPGIIVFYGRLVLRIQVDVQLGGQGAGVVAAGNGSKFVLEAIRPPGAQKVFQFVHLRGVLHRPVGLLRFGGRLLIVGDEEKGAVPYDGAAQRKSELVSPKGRFAASPFRAVLGSNGVPLPEIMRRSLEIVGSGARHDMDEAARGTAKFGGRALAYDDHFFHGVLIEGKRRPLSAALFAEKGIVEIGAIDHEIVEYAALPADVEHVSVGALPDGYAGGEQGQVEEIAAIVGQAVHDVLGKALRAGSVFRVQERRVLGGHGDFFQIDDRKGQVEDKRFARMQRQPFPADFAKIRFGDHENSVGAARQQRPRKDARRVCFDHGAQAGVEVVDNDRCVRYRLARRIVHGAPYDASRRRRLCTSRMCAKSEQAAANKRCDAENTDKNPGQGDAHGSLANAKQFIRRLCPPHRQSPRSRPFRGAAPGLS